MYLLCQLLRLIKHVYCKNIPVAHSTPSAFDHLCEASNVAGFDATIRSAPAPEARLIAVGEQPMIALYKITKVWLGCALIRTMYCHKCISHRMLVS